MNSFPPEPKANCVHCGVSLLLRTFTRTNGFCVPCASDSGAFLLFPYMRPTIESQESVDEAMASSLVADSMHTHPQRYDRWVRYLLAQEPGDQLLCVRGWLPVVLYRIPVVGILVMRNGQAIEGFYTSCDENQAVEIERAELPGRAQAHA